MGTTKKYTLGQAAAAPLDVTFGGGSYLLAPLRLTDLARFERWAKQQVIDLAAEQLADHPGMQPEHSREMIRGAIDRASTLSFGTPGGTEAMKSLDGMLQLLWLSLRQNHPDLKSSTQVADLIGDMSELGTMIEKLLGISGLMAPTDAQEASNPDPRQGQPTEGQGSPKN